MVRSPASRHHLLAVLMLLLSGGTAAAASSALAAGVTPGAGSSNSSSSGTTVVNSSSSSGTVVTVDWGSPRDPSVVPTGTTLAIPTYLDQVNPSMDARSPMHDAAFQRMDKLGAKLVRYLHWSASQAPFPETQEGVFNFTAMDQYVLDFMNCSNALSAVMNFDAGPCWLHLSGDCRKPLRDTSGKEYGEWISRIISWYTKGGFTDVRTGKVYQSPHHLRWQNYEVLNEPNLAGWIRSASSPWAVYTKVYDGIVRVLAKDHPELAISALCLAQGATPKADVYTDKWFSYFFNASNHAPGIKPPAYVTYHFYAIPDSMPKLDPWPPGDVPVAQWPPHLLTQAARFIERAEHVNGLIAAGSFGGKDVKINVDEVGIIGGKHCPVSTLFTSNKIYWNVAASLWGFYYGELARLGTTAIAASQLTGYPPATWEGVVMPGGKPVNNNFPCVSMMDWRGNGSDTARTWALQMTIDIMGNGAKRIIPANVSAPPGGAGWPLPSVVYSIGFELLDRGRRVILLSNTNSSATIVTVSGASGSVIHTVDETAGYAEVAYSSRVLSSDRILLAASAFVLIEHNISRS